MASEPTAGERVVDRWLGKRWCVTVDAERGHLAALIDLAIATAVEEAREGERKRTGESGGGA